LPQLLALLNRGNGHAAIVIDISAVKFLTPAANVSILASCSRWKKAGMSISLIGAEPCENLGYLQRIDFLYPMKLEFQMVTEFGEFLADGHVGNQFRALRTKTE
jgi:hypothetical protein